MHTMASDDTEITLGMGKLLGLFFLLAAICGVFFSIGYSLGKSSGREQALNDQPAQAECSGRYHVGEFRIQREQAFGRSRGEIRHASTRVGRGECSRPAEQHDLLQGRAAER